MTLKFTALALYSCQKYSSLVIKFEEMFNFFEIRARKIVNIYGKKYSELLWKCIFEVH